MKKEEIRKLMEENFEEITKKVWRNDSSNGEGCFYCKDGEIYFKPKQKFPIIIECRGGTKIQIDQDGDIVITNSNDNRVAFCCGASLPFLEKAMKKSKEIRAAKS